MDDEQKAPAPEPLEHIVAWPEQAAVVRAVTSLMFLERCGVMPRNEYLEVRRRIFLWDVGEEGRKASERATANRSKQWSKG
jgi:hypothetical protein